MLTDMHRLARPRHVDTLDIGEIEERHCAEEMSIPILHITYFVHLLVNVERFASSIVERHGDEVRVEHLLVFAGKVLNVARLDHLVGNVLGGVVDEPRLAVLLLCNGITVVFLPIGFLGRTVIHTQIRFGMSNSPRRHLHIEIVEHLGLIRMHTFQEVLGIHLVEGQHVAIGISDFIGS